MRKFSCESFFDGNDLKKGLSFFCDECFQKLFVFKKIFIKKNFLWHRKKIFKGVIYFGHCYCEQLGF